jgi:hypothetical protein
MLTNKTNLPLSIAAWLVADDYDHDDRPNLISATSLLKPIRSLLLNINYPPSGDTDISNLIASRLGSAIHSSIESSLKNLKLKDLVELGYSVSLVNSLEINPEEPKGIPIYVEQRAEKEFHGYIISGKFDAVVNGVLEDFKTTSTRTYTDQTMKDKYIKQGSIYKWLNPDKIIEDYMVINYIFTDWSSMKAIQDKEYPQSRIISQKFPLLTTQETEQFIKETLNTLNKYKDKQQSEYPLCTSEELWQSEGVFKYYKDPNKTSKSTKNFTNQFEAFERLRQDGNVGVVKYIEGEAKACKYCRKDKCTQAADLINQGLLNAG